jgi:hypothetical protein
VNLVEKSYHCFCTLVVRNLSNKQGYFMAGRKGPKKGTPDLVISTIRENRQATKSETPDPVTAAEKAKK